MKIVHQMLDNAKLQIRYTLTLLTAFGSYAILHPLGAKHSIVNTSIRRYRTVILSWCSVGKTLTCLFKRTSG